MGDRVMSTEPWKFIFDSAVGTSHLVTATPCQDSCICEILDCHDGSQVLFAVVADGAGSAKCAEKGAALACAHFGNEIRRYIQEGQAVHDIDSEFVKMWLRNLQDQVATNSAIEGLAPRDFASTLLVAIIGDDCGAFLQIGDGAIVIPDRDEPDIYCWVFWPQQGQYANETNFTSDESASDKIEFSLIKGCINEVAVFSDGLQGLALHYQSRQAHTPFFAPIFEWLRAAPEGYDEGYTASLSSFLNSKKVSDCTDDDKTLILATRRKPSTIQEPPQSGNANHDEIKCL
jgi:Protein phosphatase 2C